MADGEEGVERAAAREAEYVIAKAVRDGGVRDAEQPALGAADRAGADAARSSVGTAEERALGRGWSRRTADNGLGTVYQRPGATGNADMLRVMGPTQRYPHGYVRFHNEHGQPVGLDGTPGSRAHTHIPRNPDGSYPTPEGW
jgi:hypothetical protein